MCGIIGAVSNRNIVPILVSGMRRLEYRGYDSSGIAVINPSGQFDRERCVGKVEELARLLRNDSSIEGTTAIAHTRWATHGEPSENNAHPLICNNRVAVVCNGIIENYEELREQQLRKGFTFSSETDTEVIVHELYESLENGLSLVESVSETAKKLEGSYAIAVLSTNEPEKIVVSRRGSPLLIGFGDDEAFVASDVLALTNLAKSVVVLENGDIAEISGLNEALIVDQSGKQVTRTPQPILIGSELIELKNHDHYMQKEIFEQGPAIAETLEGRITNDRLLEEETFGKEASKIFDQVQAVRILACGTSYYAGMVARIWLESMGIPCEAEIASEFRYRNPVVPDKSLVVTVSQSGETADTLAAQEQASRLGFKHSLAICNSPSSSLTRLTDLVIHTHAGPEIGVASTKAFTTQLVTLLLLMISLARRKGLTAEAEAAIVNELRALPSQVEAALQLDGKISQVAEKFADKQHALFLGRGTHYPIALEGALKLKEISYIHAEAYPAGELKHGPLALVDSKMPTVAVAPNNHLLAKLKSNIQEVRARGGRLIVFSDLGTPIASDDSIEVIEIVRSGVYGSPILHTIALQLLAYHVAVIKGTDIDKPRNLAKSVRE